MKWFWRKYKRGIPLSLLVLVLIFLAIKVLELLGAAAEFLKVWLPQHHQAMRMLIIFTFVAAVPFLLGCIVGFKWLHRLLEKALSPFPKIHWVIKAIFERSHYEEQIKRNDKVVLFYVCNCGQDPSLKIGAVVQTFQRLGNHTFSEEHYLILEGTPPLPTGPLWIKKKSEVIAISPEFGVKDWVIAVLSMGLNFPAEKKSSSNSA